HARIVVGPALPLAYPNADFYIDDMVNPLFTHNVITSYGFNVIEINVNFGPTTGYYDDISFAIARPPNLSAARMGSNLVLTWDGSATLQSASTVSGPYSDVSGAASPYPYDLGTSPQQFFRLRR